MNQTMGAIGWLSILSTVMLELASAGFGGRPASLAAPIAAQVTSYRTVLVVGNDLCVFTTGSPL